MGLNNNLTPAARTRKIFNQRKFTLEKKAFELGQVGGRVVLAYMGPHDNSVIIFESSPGLLRDVMNYKHHRKSPDDFITKSDYLKKNPKPQVLSSVEEQSSSSDSGTQPVEISSSPLFPPTPTTPSHEALQASPLMESVLELRPARRGPTPSGPPTIAQRERDSPPPSPVGKMVRSQRRRLDSLFELAPHRNNRRMNGRGLRGLRRDRL